MPVDTTTQLPGSGGGGNAGSSFSDAYFNIYSDADPSKLLGFDASLVAAGTRPVLRLPATLGTGNFTSVFAELSNAFTDNQTMLDTGGSCLTLRSTQVSTGGTFLDVQDTVSAFPLNFLGPPNGFSAARNHTVQNANGTLVLGGDGADPPAAAHMGVVNKTAQSAAIAVTNLTNAVAAGYYLVHYTLVDTSTQVGVATVQFQINYTDDAGATNQTGVALSLTATGRDRGTFHVYLASGDVTYQTNVTGVIGAGRYALRVRIIALG